MDTGLLITSARHAPWMKQSDIDRELQRLAKAAAKTQGWKSISTTPYWTAGPLFFSLRLGAGAKEGSFYACLAFKWLELDRLLWQVLGMSGNERAPFSLHANGAFVLSGWDIDTIAVRDLAWEPGMLEQQIQHAFAQAAAWAQEVALQVDSLDAYTAYLSREHEAFMQRHPQAKRTIWKELLLVHMLRGEKQAAADIARARIAEGDAGGFQSNGKSFFEHALTRNAG